MIKSKKFYLRFFALGSGGWHCDCCAPGKPRKKVFKAMKQKEKRLIDKLIKSED